MKYVLFFCAIIVIIFSVFFLVFIMLNDKAQMDEEANNICIKKGFDGYEKYSHGRNFTPIAIVCKYADNSREVILKIVGDSNE